MVEGSYKGYISIIDNETVDGLAKKVHNLAEIEENIPITDFIMSLRIDSLKNGK